MPMINNQCQCVFGKFSTVLQKKNQKSSIFMYFYVIFNLIFTEPQGADLGGASRCAPPGAEGALRPAVIVIGPALARPRPRPRAAEPRSLNVPGWSDGRKNY